MYLLTSPDAGGAQAAPDRLPGTQGSSPSLPPIQSPGELWSPDLGARRPSCGSHSCTKSGLFGLHYRPGHVLALWSRSACWTSASELSVSLSDDLVSTCGCKETSSFQDTYDE